MSKLANWGAALVLSLVSLSSQASLIINGSFEDNVVTARNGTWQEFNASSVTGWSGTHTIELWRNMSPASFHGLQHLELNSGGIGPFSIWQDVSTSQDNWYTLSFAARKRDNNVNEVFTVSVFDMLSNSMTELMSEFVVSPRQWSVFTFRFQAASESTRIQFTSVSPNTTLGNFIDDVKLVPAPGGLLMMALVLLGLGARRRLS